MKKLMALLLVLCMVFSLAACAGSSDDAEKGETAKEDTTKEDTVTEDTNKEDTAASGDREKVVIGASFNSLMNDVFTVSKTLMETWAAEPLNEGDPYIDLTILVADGDTTKQISDVNDLINKGCDVMRSSSTLLIPQLLSLLSRPARMPVSPVLHTTDLSVMLLRHVLT